jgi:trk system potassium uptake protein
MYIIIVGGGSVGYYLCKALLNEGHEVLVLDKDSVKCERFSDELGSVCIRGDGCEVATLADAGTGRADVFIATTNEDEDNLVACQVAKYKFNVPRTISRVSNPENAEIFKKLGIDCTIGVTNLIMKHIEEEIPSHALIHLLSSSSEGTEIIEIKLDNESRAVDKSIKNLNVPADSIIALLMRNGEKPRIPTPEIVLKPNDRLIAFTTSSSESTLRQELLGR